MKRRRLSKQERQQVYRKCHGHCAYCGSRLKYEDMQVDHVIPLNGYSQQGTDTLDNMLPACRSCNHYKSSQPLESFRRAIERMPDVLQQDNVIYQIAVRFGMVKPRRKRVVFYFERRNQ